MHTIIVAGDNAFSRFTCCHKFMLLPIHCYGRNNGCEWRELVKNVCSYQVLLIVIKTKDADEDRRVISLGFHIDECEVFLNQK